MVACVIATGCATQAHGPVTSDLRSIPAHYDGMTVVARGYLVKQEFGGYYLYTDKPAAQVEDYASGIDVVVDSGRSRSQLADFLHGDCAMVTGMFMHFSGDVIAIGYYRSELGYITVHEVQKASCDD